MYVFSQGEPGDTGENGIPGPRGQRGSLVRYCSSLNKCICSNGSNQFYPIKILLRYLCSLWRDLLLLSNVTVKGRGNKKVG